MSIEPCPRGHQVDEDECPYPVKEGWQINCGLNCGWSVLAETKEEAVEIWNKREGE